MASPKLPPSPIRRTVTRLRRSLAENLGQPPGEQTDYDAHHLIPADYIQRYAVLRAAEAIGWSIDESSNGMWLPNSVEMSKKTGLPLHRGAHRQDYHDFVCARIEPIEKAWRAGTLKGAALRSRLEAVSAETRQALLDRKIFLQYNDPHDPDAGKIVPLIVPPKPSLPRRPFMPTRLVIGM